MTVALALFAPAIAGGLVEGTSTVHEYEAIVRPQDAALAAALRETFWPGNTDPGSTTAAIGRSAAATAPAAFAMPAPQVFAVHRHSS